jgi:predicted amidophosphoribosyltransferase
MAKVRDLRIDERAARPVTGFVWRESMVYRRGVTVQSILQRFTRKRRCPHCRRRLSLFRAPTECPGCGRQIYTSADRRRRY